MTSTSEKKKSMKPTPEDAVRNSVMQKTGAYTLYQGHDKGQVGDAIHATLCCSVDFLIQLVDDIQLLCELEKNAWHIKNCPTAPSFVANRVYQIIEAEVARLVTHPSLFPNEDLRKSFHHHVHVWSKAGKELAEGWHKSRTLLAESSKQIHDNQGNWFHKCRDPKRTPWQQFLHSNGPGSGIDTLTFPNEGCTQVLPHAGLELLHGWIDTHEAIQRQVKPDDDIDEIHRPMIRDVDTSEALENGNIRKVLQRKDLPWPDIQSVGSHVPRRYDFVADLEELNNDFEILEGRPETNPANPVPASIITEFKRKE